VCRGFWFLGGRKSLLLVICDRLWEQPTLKDTTLYSGKANRILGVLLTSTLES